MPLLPCLHYLRRPPAQCNRTVLQMPVTHLLHLPQMPRGAGNAALAKDMQSKLLDLQVGDWTCRNIRSCMCKLNPWRQHATICSCMLQRTSREMDAVFRMQSMSSAASGQLLGKR
jgi:hypothetical protein